MIQQERHIWLIAGNDPIGRRRQRTAAVLPLFYETECSLTSSSQKTPQDYWNRAEACVTLSQCLEKRRNPRDHAGCGITSSPFELSVMVSVPPWTNATSLASYRRSEAWLPLKIVEDEAVRPRTICYCLTNYSVPVPSVTVLPLDTMLTVSCHCHR